MKIPKRIEVFHDIEDRDSYFIAGAKGVMEALMYLEIEYPEAKGKFLPKHGREVPMYKCLDCDDGVHWYTEDGVCGGCGESRLSKRAKYHWYFDKSKLIT